MAEVEMKGHAKLMPGVLECNSDSKLVKACRISLFKRILNFIIVGLLAKK